MPKKFTAHKRYGASLKATDAGFHPGDVTLDVVNDHLLKIGKRLSLLAAIDAARPPGNDPSHREQHDAGRKRTDNKTVSLCQQRIEAQHQHGDAADT